MARATQPTRLSRFLQPVSSEEHRSAASLETWKHVSSNKLGFTETPSPANAWEGVFLCVFAACRHTVSQTAARPQPVMMSRAFWPLETPNAHTLLRLLFWHPAITCSKSRLSVQHRMQPHLLPLTPPSAQLPPRLLQLHHRCLLAHDARLPKAHSAVRPAFQRL